MYVLIIVGSNMYRGLSKYYVSIFRVFVITRPSLHFIIFSLYLEPYIIMQITMPSSKVWPIHSDLDDDIGSKI